MININYYVVQFLVVSLVLYLDVMQSTGAQGMACQGIGSQSKLSGTEFQTLIFIFIQACDGLTLFHQRGNCLFL